MSSKGTTVKKISLSKETLRVLTVQEAGAVAGAATYKFCGGTIFTGNQTVCNPGCTLVEPTSPAATCAHDTKNDTFCVPLPVSQASPRCPTI